jgi:hypothetical protein
LLWIKREKVVNVNKRWSCAMPSSLVGWAELFSCELLRLIRKGRHTVIPVTQLVT